MTISAKKDLMIKNIVSRYGIQNENAEKMLNNQMNIQKKVERSTFVIQNNGSYDEFISNGKKLAKKLSEVEK